MSASAKGQQHGRVNAGLGDVLIVGAGFAGMHMLHKLRNAGFQVRCFESGGGPGGTWYWNRYPGARCDIHSLAYSYSFSKELEQDWEWSELYALLPITTAATRRKASGSVHPEEDVGRLAIVGAETVKGFARCLGRPRHTFQGDHPVAGESCENNFVSNFTLPANGPQPRRALNSAPSRTCGPSIS